MPSTVIVTDKQGRRYAYRSTSYWDKEKKAPRSRKEYLGRVDEQGNILPKKVSPESRTDETPQAPVSNCFFTPDAVALLEQIDRRMEKIESAIAALSTAWKSVGSIVGKK